VNRVNNLLACNSLFVDLCCYIDLNLKACKEDAVFIDRERYADGFQSFPGGKEPVACDRSVLSDLLPFDLCTCCWEFHPTNSFLKREEMSFRICRGFPNGSFRAMIDSIVSGSTKMLSRPSYISVYIQLSRRSLPVSAICMSGIGLQCFLL
jgi:hypothetical protein